MWMSSHRYSVWYFDTYENVYYFWCNIWDVIPIFGILCFILFLLFCVYDDMVSTVYLHDVYMWFYFFFFFISILSFFPLFMDFVCIWCMYMWHEISYVTSNGDFVGMTCTNLWYVGMRIPLTIAMQVKLKWEDKDILLLKGENKESSNVQ